MTISDTALIEASCTPQDQNVADDMVTFLSLIRPPLGFLFSVFAATLQSFYSGCLDVRKRGCIERGLFDHIQGSGVIEKPLLVPFLQSVPASDYGVGTSPKGRQYLHDKKLLGNVPMTTDQEHWALSQDPKQWTSWQAAMQAGYPVAWVGSWNISPAASLQSNTTLQIVSAPIVIAFRDQILANLAWVQQYEPNLQVVTQALSSGDESLLYGPQGVNDA